jgi:TonB family protein
MAWEVSKLLPTSTLTLAVADFCRRIDVPSNTAILSEITPPSDVPVPVSSHTVTADDYPPVSIRLAEQGVVKVHFLVNENGRVDDCTIAETSGKPRLDTAACIMVKKRWVFKAAVHDGMPTAAWVDDQVSFTLR